MSRFGRMVVRGRDGQYRLRFDDDVRDLLRGIPVQLRQLLGQERESQALRRLFPPAYADQPELEAEYQRLMGDDLLQRRLDAIEVMETSIEARQLDESQLHAWLATLHDFRIVLGTALDVTEDLYDQQIPPDDPRLPGLALYEALTELESEFVHGLSSGLPEGHNDE